MYTIQYLSLCSGGFAVGLTLCSTGTRLPQQLLGFTTEIVDAMNYLSNKGYIHRSLQGKYVSIDRGMHCKVGMDICTCVRVYVCTLSDQLRVNGDAVTVYVPQEHIYSFTGALSCTTSGEALAGLSWAGYCTSVSQSVPVCWLLWLLWVLSGVRDVVFMVDEDSLPCVGSVSSSFRRYWRL